MFHWSVYPSARVYCLGYLELYSQQYQVNSFTVFFANNIFTILVPVFFYILVRISLSVYKEKYYWHFDRNCIIHINHFGRGIDIFMLNLQSHEYSMSLHLFRPL